jgi:hypothetical protein
LHCTTEVLYFRRCVCSLQAVCVFSSGGVCVLFRRCVCSLQAVCVFSQAVCVLFRQCVLFRHCVFSSGIVFQQVFRPWPPTSTCPRRDVSSCQSLGPGHYQQVQNFGREGPTALFSSGSVCFLQAVCVLFRMCLCVVSSDCVCVCGLVRLCVCVFT